MLFVDHKTRPIYPSFQELKTSSEACRSKGDYETFTKCYKVNVESYQADNSAFQTETFQKYFDKKKQKLNFRGVNTQWKNGLVKRSNGTLRAAA
jgi:hypothetical protein